jgi:uncharacterized membrane protein YqaE (UPF0057 family)
LKFAKRIQEKHMNTKITRILIGLVLPPLGVFLTFGVGTTLLINILLTLIGWLPGSIHAAWAIAKHYENLEGRGEAYR